MWQERRDKSKEGFCYNIDLSIDLEFERRKEETWVAIRGSDWRKATNKNGIIASIDRY